MKSAVDIYDKLYGLWYPYYHPVVSPETPPFLYHYPYYNPFAKDFADTVDSYRKKIRDVKPRDYEAWTPEKELKEAVKDNADAIDRTVQTVTGKIYENHSKAVADAAEASDAQAKKQLGLDPAKKE